MLSVSARRVVVLAAPLFGVLLAGCPDPLCTPGASVECACPGGETGAQTCRDDGSGFEECRCDGPEPEAEPEPAPEPDAEPEGTPDGGVLDGGPVVDVDGGYPQDAGPQEDGGASPGDDAGPVDDGGPNFDAGGDAGPERDGGVDSDGGGIVDGGPDGGAVDGGPVGACSTTTGEFGGACVDGETCSDGSRCFEEFSELPNGLATTLGNLFGLPTGIDDPDRPGEFIPGPPSTVPVRVVPDGLCSQACTFGPDSGCGDCAACTGEIGPSRTFSTIGLDVRPFFVGVEAGICRPRCEYDPTLATNGGCPADYTCSKTGGVCVEACASDAQCNVRFGQSRSEGLVAGLGSGWTCDEVSGQCIHPENGAQQGDACSEDLDCSQNAICFGGRCASVACGLVEGTPVPCDSVCVALSGGAATLCVESCSSGDDCFRQQACAPFAPGAGVDGVCAPTCTADSECRTDQRCRADVGEAPGDGVPFGECRDLCDPDLNDVNAIADAVLCGESAICVQVDGREHGFCEPLSGLCSADSDCVGGQACELLGADALGRCIEGCAINNECDAASNEECVIQPGSATGVCRAPAGACSTSEEGVGAFRPLAGDAQCISGERCNASAPNELAACEPL